MHKIPWRFSRDEAVELCLEALATGTVLGYSPNHDPDVLTTDTSFAQNGNGDLTMWRDWGLFEAFYSRWQTGLPWQCDGIMVQAHRMKKPPKWKAVRKELAGLGHEFAPGHSAPDTVNHLVIASGSNASVGEEIEKYSGRIMKVYIPAKPPMPSHPASLLPTSGSTSPAIREILQGLRTIAGTAEGAWPRWLDQHHPAPGDWELYLGQLFNLHRDEPDRRDEWTAFGLWLLDQARAAGVWPADEWAWRWADFVLDRPGAVPGPEVTRTCLAALPMTAAEAADLPADWRARTPEDIRRSRMTLALLRFAAAGETPVPPPPSPALAEWQPVVPRLC